MKEFDLNDAWKNSDEKAEEYYSQIKSEIMELAQKRSESILDKLKRTIIGEWITSVIIFIGFLYMYSGSLYFWQGVLGLILLVVIAALPYLKMWKDLKSTPTQNMVACLQNYIKILDGFIKRIKHLLWIMLPVGFVTGLFLSIDPSATFDIAKIEWSKLGFIIALSAVLLWGIYWLTFKYYVPKLYGNPKREFQEILESLKEE